MAAEYRIVTDQYCGFEVQIRRWWWPFWTQVGLANTHTSIERAEAFARGHSKIVVKNLGRLQQD